MSGSTEKESERASHPLGGDLSGAPPTHLQGTAAGNEGLLASRITRIEEMMEQINQTVRQALQAWEMMVLAVSRKQRRKFGSAKECRRIGCHGRERCS